MFGSDDYNYYEPPTPVRLKEIPEGKTYRHVGVNYGGEGYGWLMPGPKDPYSEPYLVIIETEKEPRNESIRNVR